MSKHRGRMYFFPIVQTISILFLFFTHEILSESLIMKAPISDIFLTLDEPLADTIFPDLYFESPISGSPIFMRIDEVTLPTGLATQMSTAKQTASKTGTEALSLVYRDDVLYVGAANSGFSVLGISADRSEITQLDYISSLDGRVFKNVILSYDGQYAYYAAEKDGLSNLRVCDISNPTNIFVVSSYLVGEEMWWMTYNPLEEILFISKFDDGNIDIVNVTDPYHPHNITLLDITEDIAKTSVLSTDYELLFLSTSSSYQVDIYNVSDVQDIVKISNTASLPYAETLTPHPFEKILYVGCFYSNVLTIVDYSNLLSPSIVLRTEEFCSEYIEEIKLMGTKYLILSCKEEGVKVLDISENPIAPVLKFEYVNDYAYNSDYFGNYLFVSRYSYGLEVVRFGDADINGIPTVCGDYEVTVHAEDCYGNNMSTSFTVRVRDDLHYFDPLCSVYMCNGTLSNDTLNVCNGHGDCLFREGGSRVDGECVCDRGYFTEDGNSDDDDICNSWNCGYFSKNDKTKVCSNHGNCNDLDICACTDNYEGRNCESWSCGYERIDPRTCRGNGKCISPKKCECDAMYTGNECQTNLAYSTVMAPLLSVSGGFGLLLLMCLCCSGMFCILFCCVAVFVLCFSSAVLIVVSTFQKFRLGKFEKITNLDMVLAEQKTEQDTSVAHLRMNKDLFKIDMSEIRVDRILGEGGSMSVVFRAVWKNRIVAFKCFKTRHLCGNSDSYHEFEREVEVMASISHPNIIRFFGATMKPPRVGIVMEYCENGDLQVFITKFQIKYAMCYPLKEKLRMCLEIISAFDYIHARNIIHRDLKLENVLVDLNMSCKLMDFGLSKIVNSMSKIKTKKIGTCYYMAPELVLGGGKYDEKVDVFAFGMLLYILITEMRDPYEDMTDDDDGDHVIHYELRVANDESFRPNLEELDEEKLNEMYSNCSDGEVISGWIKDVLKSCWCHDSNERMSFAQLSELFTKKIESIQGNMMMEDKNSKIPRSTSSSNLQLSDDDDDTKKKNSVSSMSNKSRGRYFKNAEIKIQKIKELLSKESSSSFCTDENCGLKENILKIILE